MEHRRKSPNTHKNHRIFMLMILSEWWEGIQSHKEVEHKMGGSPPNGLIKKKRKSGWAINKKSGGENPYNPGVEEGAPGEPSGRIKPGQVGSMGWVE